MLRGEAEHHVTVFAKLAVACFWAIRGGVGFGLALGQSGASDPAPVVNGCDERDLGECCRRALSHPRGVLERPLSRGR